MAEYHGDLMYKVGNVYERQDDRNYPIALILLFFFGFTGLHRFYLNDLKAGTIYMTVFFLAMMVGILTFNLTLIVWYFSLVSVVLLCEFFFFTYLWVKQSS